MKGEVEISLSRLRNTIMHSHMSASHQPLRIRPAIAQSALAELWIALCTPIRLGGGRDVSFHSYDVES